MSAPTWRFLEADDHAAPHNAGRPLTIVDGNNDTVAEVYSKDDATVAITRAEAVAHAHMIAAAPDTLAALENIVIALGMGWDMDGVIDAANRAIARAEGRS